MKANAYECLHPEDDISLDDEDILSIESVSESVDRDHFRDMMMANGALESDEEHGD